MPGKTRPVQKSLEGKIETLMFNAIKHFGISRSSRGRLDRATRPRPELCYTAHRVVTIRKSRPLGEKRKSRPSHDTLENPQNTHNRPPQSPEKIKRQ